MITPFVFTKMFKIYLSIYKDATKQISFLDLAKYKYHQLKPDRNLI